MAYYENNQREYELTKHISLLQLNPVALLQLKTAGVCEFQVPEWLYDMDCPGHYLRRIKTVSLTLPCVSGPYTGIHCALHLLKSTIRQSSALIDDVYVADNPDKDFRFRRYHAAIQSIVTSSAQNDGGLFEFNLRDERYLPFEGAGADSVWRLELPVGIRQFDYNTISDVVLHVRYTAREGGELLRDKARENFLTLFTTDLEDTKTFSRLFSLPHDFPNEWHRFITTDQDMQITLKRQHFPYFAQAFEVEVRMLMLLSPAGESTVITVPSSLNGDLERNSSYTFGITANRTAPNSFMLVTYALKPRQGT